MQQLKNHSAPAAKEDDIQDQLSPKSILWSLTGGEADQYQGRSFAVDGIDNIIEFLDKLENEEIEWIDFLELRACDQSCAGGILVHGNRFLIVDKMKKRAVVQRINQKNATSDVASAHRSYLFDSVRINPIEPRPLIRLDSDPAEALKKMQYYREILKTLPGLDCGACGAPNCQVHAEDIARGESSLERCVFVYNKNKNQSEITENPENPNVIERIWGKSRFQQNKLKDQL